MRTCHLKEHKMKNETIYEELNFEIINFESVDVIITSTHGEEEGGNGEIIGGNP